LTAGTKFGDVKESVNKHRNIDLRLITEYQLVRCYDTLLPQSHESAPPLMTMPLSSSN